MILGFLICCVLLKGVKLELLSAFFEQRSVVLLADLQVTCLLQVYFWVELRLCDLQTRRIQCFFCVGLNVG